MLNGVIARQITKKFGNVKAIDDLSFEVNEGEVFALLGPNGAGKTTTLRILACIISSSGTAQVAGFDISKEAEKVRSLVGIVTENPSLYERLTAYENLEFFATAYGLNDKTERRRRINEKLERFDLWDRRNDRVGGYSKGMKQKLAFIRALLHQPKVLLLDEPTANLDPSASRQIMVEIDELRHCGVSILLSTHRLEDVRKLADRVMILSGGKAVAIGRPDQLAADSTEKLHIVLKEIGPNMIEVAKATGLPFSQQVEGKNHELIFEVKNDFDEVVPGIVRALVLAGGEIVSVYTEGTSFEDVYLKILKDGLR